MSTRVLLTIALALTISGCARVADSRLNPFNWFGRSQSVETTEINPDAGPTLLLVGQITSLRVEQVPAGAIVRATGLPGRQGFYDGNLVPVGAEVAVNGVLSYQFTISPPKEQTRVGPARSREIVVGRFVSSQTLEGVRQIRVVAASNALAVRR